MRPVNHPNIPFQIKCNYCIHITTKYALLPQWTSPFLFEKMNALVHIICLSHSYETLIVHCHSNILPTPWTVLDDLMTLAKLPPVPERVPHLQVTHQKCTQYQGGGGGTQVTCQNQLIWSMHTLHMSSPTNPEPTGT